MAWQFAFEINWPLEMKLAPEKVPKIETEILPEIVSEIVPKVAPKIVQKIVPKIAPKIVPKKCQRYTTTSNRVEQETKREILHWMNIAKNRDINSNQNSVTFLSKIALKIGIFL